MSLLLSRTPLPCIGRSSIKCWHSVRPAITPACTAQTASIKSHYSTPYHSWKSSSATLNVSALDPSRQVRVHPRRRCIAISAAAHGSDIPTQRSHQEIRPSNIYIAVSPCWSTHTCATSLKTRSPVTPILPFSWITVSWLPAVEHFGGCCFRCGKQSSLQTCSRSCGRLHLFFGSAANLWLCSSIFLCFVLALQVVSATSSIKSVVWYLSLVT